MLLEDKDEVRLFDLNLGLFAADEQQRVHDDDGDDDDDDVATLYV